MWMSILNAKTGSFNLLNKLLIVVSIEFVEFLSVGFGLYLVSLVVLVS